MALSFNRAGMPTAWTGFSVTWYGKLMESPEILSAAVNTLIVAGISTAVATTLGTHARPRRRAAKSDSRAPLTRCCSRR